MVSNVVLDHSTRLVSCPECSIVVPSKIYTSSSERTRSSSVATTTSQESRPKREERTCQSTIPSFERVLGDKGPSDIPNLDGAVSRRCRSRRGLAEPKRNNGDLGLVSGSPADFADLERRTDGPEGRVLCLARVSHVPNLLGEPASEGALAGRPKIFDRGRRLLTLTFLSNAPLTIHPPPSFPSPFSSVPSFQSRPMMLSPPCAPNLRPTNLLPIRQSIQPSVPFSRPMTMCVGEEGQMAREVMGWEA
jgi:hypothetical protein